MPMQMPDSLIAIVVACQQLKHAMLLMLTVLWHWHTHTMLLQWLLLHLMRKRLIPRQKLLLLLQLPLSLC